MVGNVILYVSLAFPRLSTLTARAVLPARCVSSPAVSDASVPPASRNSTTPSGQRHVPA